MAQDEARETSMDLPAPCSIGIMWEFIRNADFGPDSRIIESESKF